MRPPPSRRTTRWSSGAAVCQSNTGPIRSDTRDSSAGPGRSPLSTPPPFRRLFSCRRARQNQILRRNGAETEPRYLMHAAIRMFRSLLTTVRGEGHHGTQLPAGLFTKPARIRRVAQGKCRTEFDPGDGNTGDGVGGSLFCGTSRQSHRIFQYHRPEVRPGRHRRDRNPAAPLDRARPRCCGGRVLRENDVGL